MSGELKGVRDLARLATQPGRPAQQEGHHDGLVPGPLFVVLSLRAEHVAVIGGEDEDGVVLDPGLLHRCQQLAQACVQRRAVGIVETLAFGGGNEALPPAAVQVPLADVGGVVAGAFELLADGWGVGGQVRVVEKEAVRQRVLPRQQTGPVGRADRTARDGVGEVDASSDQCVEVGRFDIGIAGVAGGLGAPLVGEYEHQIGSRRRLAAQRLTQGRRSRQAEPGRHESAGPSALRRSVTCIVKHVALPHSRNRFQASRPLRGRGGP